MAHKTALEKINEILFDIFDDVLDFVECVLERYKKEKKK